MSKKRRTAVNEVKAKDTVSRCFESACSIVTCIQMKNSSSKKSVPSGSTVVVLSGKCFSFSPLQVAKQQISDPKQYVFSVRELPIHFKQLSRKMKEVCVHVLFNLLGGETTCSCGYGEKVISSGHEPLKSGYPIAYNTSCSTSTLKRYSAFSKISKKNLVQLVAAPNFYGEKDGSCDVEMDKNDKKAHESVSFRENIFRCGLQKHIVLSVYSKEEKVEVLKNNF